MAPEGQCECTPAAAAAVAARPPADPPSSAALPGPGPAYAIMDTPAIQALMESAAAEPAAQPPQLPNALQVASGLDSLPIHALQPMAGLPGFPALMNPAQVCAHAAGAGDHELGGLGRWL